MAYLNELLIISEIPVKCINLLAVIFHHCSVLFRSSFQLCLELVGIGLQAMYLRMELLALSIQLFLHASNFLAKSQVLLHQT